MAERRPSTSYRATSVFCGARAGDTDNRREPRPPPAAAPATA